MTDLYRRLSDLETLKRGYAYAKKSLEEQFDAPLLQEVYTSDPGRFRDFLNAMARSLASSQYAPARSLSIPLPKAYPFTRPSRVIPFEDSVVLYAIAYLLAPLVDPKIPSRVYSSRLRRDYKRSDRLFEFRPLETIPLLKRTRVRRAKIVHEWPYLWVNFQRSLLRAYAAHGYSWALKLDLTGFFEHIQHDVLADILARFAPREHRLHGLIMTMVTRHVEAPDANGIAARAVGLAQGHEVSNFLANMYLAPLDDLLEQMRGRKEIEWSRYVDDIYVFAGSRDSLIGAAHVIEGRVRSLGLSLNAAKCRILRGSQIATSLTHPQMDIVNRAWKRFPWTPSARTVAARDRLMRVVGPLVRGLQRAHAPLQGEKRQRLLKRVLTILGELKSPALVRRVTKELLVPRFYDGALWSKAVRYFRAVNPTPKMARRFGKLLVAASTPPWIRAKILQMAPCWRGKLPTPRSKIVRLAVDQEEHWLVRKYAAAALVEVRLTANNLAALRASFLREYSLEMLEALSLPLRQSGTRSRRAMLGHAKRCSYAGARAQMFSQYLQDEWGNPA